MTELFGLLDALESSILEGKRVPLTDRIMVDEKKVLSLLEKIRLVLNNDGSFVREKVDLSRKEKTFSSVEASTYTEALAKAHEEGRKIKDGAKEYADYMMANLQLLVTKMHKNLMKLEKNIEDSRDVLKHGKGEENLNERL